MIFGKALREQLNGVVIRCLLLSLQSVKCEMHALCNLLLMTLWKMSNQPKRKILYHNILKVPFRWCLVNVNVTFELPSINLRELHV